MAGICGVKYISAIIFLFKGLNLQNEAKLLNSFNT